ncbi:unnamed protein product, partial [Prorocentrum cordatum]
MPQAENFEQLSPEQKVTMMEAIKKFQLDLDTLSGFLHDLTKTRRGLIDMVAPYGCEDDSSWEGVSALSTILAVDLRMKKQFPNGFAAAEPMLLTSFAKDLHVRCKMELFDVAVAYVASLVEDGEWVGRTVVQLLKFTIDKAREDTSSMLRATVGPGTLEQLPVPIDFIATCIDESGRMDEALQRMAARLEETEAIQKIDHVKTVVKILETIDKEGNHPDQSKLDLMIRAIPSLKAIAACQPVEVLVPTVPTDDFPDWEEVQAFLNKFPEVTRECKAFATLDADKVESKQEDLKRLATQFNAYVKRTSKDLDKLAEIWHNEKMKRSSDELETLLFDPKPLLKKLDDKIQELIEFPNRVRMVELVKMLNTEIKHGGKFVDALGGTDKNCEDYEKVSNAAKATRKKARLLITCRTGCQIIQKKKVSDIKKFYQEASSLQVQVPAEIKKQLDELQKTTPP